jgi:SAM-dependent methyltransferase
MRSKVAVIGVVFLCAAGPGRAGLAGQALPQDASRALAGDAAAGKRVFERGGNCLTCHSIEQRGTATARDLSWIGVLRTPAALRRALSDRSIHTIDANGPEIDQLVAYLQTLRTLWSIEPHERTRPIAPASENVGFFDRPKRDAEEQPERIIEALDLREGARVADVGAGTGYFTWRLARQVGPTGRVIAVDIQQAMLDRTAAAVRKHDLSNVDYVLATAGDPRLPEGSLDLVFIAYAYHEFSEPEATMAAIRRSLKPDGRVVVLEFAQESNLAPASPLHKMSFEEIRSEIEPMGFVVDRLLDFLPVQHGVIFIRRP